MIGLSSWMARLPPDSGLSTVQTSSGVTDVANTGANRAQSDVITGLIPQDVGSSPLMFGDGGFSAPVGCAR